MIKLNTKYYLANFRQPIYRIYLLLEICFKNVLHRVNALYVLIWSFKMSFKFSIIIATAWESFLLKQPQRAHEEREGLHLHSLNVSKHESVRRKNENGSVLQYRVRGIDSSSKCHASYAMRWFSCFSFNWEWNFKSQILFDPTSTSDSKIENK